MIIQVKQINHISGQSLRLQFVKTPHEFMRSASEFSVTQSGNGYRTDAYNVYTNFKLELQ